MGNDKELKTKLFNTGAMAFNAVFGNKQNLYHCPICASAFRQEALDRGELTLEHIPPKAQGGKK